MTADLQHTALADPGLANNEPGCAANKKPRLELLDTSWGAMKWPLMFLLSLTMAGLRFPPGYILALIILINRYRNDKHEFVAYVTLMCGGYGFLTESSTFIKLEDVAFLISVIGIVVYRQPVRLRRVTILFLLYCAVIFGCACFSDESLSIQIRLMRTYFMFIFYMIPIMVFAKEEFHIRELFKPLLRLMIIVSIFYLIDVLILHGRFMVPGTKQLWQETTFWDPEVEPLMFDLILRKSSHGLLFLLLCTYPLCRFYKLRIWNWVVIIGAVLTTLTMAFIAGLVAGMVLFQPNRKLKTRIIVLSIVLLGGLYVIDPAPKKKGEESPMRIKSTIEQFIALTTAEDDEDLAAFASGRGAQAIPKLELLNTYGKTWTGLGFLHPDLTTDTRYIIDNELYVDIEQSEEVAAQIEMFPLNIYLQTGIIGFVANAVFFIGLYFIIRKWEYSQWYLSTLVCLWVMGIGGITGWANTMSLFMLALPFAASWLSSRQKFEKEDYCCPKKQERT